MVAGAPETPAPAAARTASPGRRTATGTAVRLLIAAVLTGQLVVLLRRSAAQYAAGDLALDFAIFGQAWHRIGAGDLSPYSTVLAGPYWRSHLELVMWPLALLGRVFPSDLTLLVVQDLAEVGAEALAVLWVLEAGRRAGGDRLRRALPALAVLALFVLDDRVALAARGDFHFQAVATLLLVGGARELWRGRLRQAWWWLLPALLTGDVAGTYVAGLGASAVLARRDTRRAGLLLVVVGVGWTAAVGLLGANRGSALGGYAELVGHPLPSTGGALVVGLAVLAHSSRALSLLGTKSALLARDLVGTGAVGLLHPWTVGVCAVVVLANGLQASPVFVSPFQDLPAIVFGTAGTGLVLDRLTRWRPRGSSLAGRALLVGTAGLTVLVAGLGRPPTLPGYPEPAGAARQVSAVDRLLRPHDQVVASFGVVGRFAGRRSVDPVRPGAVPVREDRVVFVLSDTIGNEPVGQRAVVAQAARALGAQVVLDSPDLVVLVWQPPAGSTSVTLP